MQLSKIIFVGILCLLMSAPGTAQERAKRRAENKANQRVDQKVDDAVNKAADAIEGLFKKKNSDNTENPPAEGEEAAPQGDSTEVREGGIFGSMGFGEEFEPYENPVQMSMSMAMITTDKRGKVQEMTMHYTFDTWATGMEMIAEEGQTKILLDNQKGKMTVVTSDDGKTQAIRMRQPRVDYAEFMPDESEFTITDLGNTKVINGYNCREYLIEHEDGTTNAWLTNDIDADYEGVLRAMAMQTRQKKGKNGNQPIIPFKGFPIQTTTVSEDGKETVETTYSNLRFGADIDKSVFDLEGVEIMDIGF
jgi:outer membrane lipoprotein-sorting protein